jgi:hypothetical protein
MMIVIGIMQIVIIPGKFATVLINEYESRKLCQTAAQQGTNANQGDRGKSS